MNKTWILIAGLLWLPACGSSPVSGPSRTLGAVIDDAAIELKAVGVVQETPALKDQAHINATSVNAVVLLTGEVATTEVRDRMLEEVRKIDGVRQVVDEMRIAPPSSLAARAHDTWLTTKVKARLINLKNLDATKVKVITENKVVYLMGLVRRQEGDAAAEAASIASGVERVVKLFESTD